VNGGKDFGQRQPLTQRDSHSPSIAVEEGIVHVVWRDKRDGNDEIYYMHSGDNGATWEDRVRLMWRYMI